MTLSTAPQLFNIPAGMPFAGVLAEGLLARAAGDPALLAQTVLLLPTRRACRTVQDAFLARSQGKALLLPRLRPLGDFDPAELALSVAETALDIPPAISPLRRQLLLTRLILEQEVGGRARSPDEAAGLAAALAALLDQIHTEGLDYDALAGLVPDKFSEHWQITLEFLQIIGAHWPAILADEGAIDPADRRNRLLRAQAVLWSAHPPAGPVIAAGSSGSIPAAAEFLGVVARLPQGQVVLPGLDMILDEESWAVLEPTHPQFALKQTLERIGVDRGGVQIWPGAEDAPAHAERPGRTIEPRRALWSQAMRPAATSENWRDLSGGGIGAAAIEGLTRLDCATPQEEAEVIALIMRRALEAEEQCAALVTPDRFLARRVAMSLRRWGIEVDDTGGASLPMTAVGAWLRLTAALALEKTAPVALLACLKHPLAGGGLSPHDFRDMLRMLEHAVLRGARPGPGFDGLRQALESAEGLKEERREKLLGWLDELDGRVQKFMALFENGERQPFISFLNRHIKAAEALAETDNKSGAERIWCFEDGETAARFVADLMQASRDLPPVSGADYVALLENLMRGVTVRPRYGTHPRLAILGQLEARLFQPDVMILGGLNEGSWPADPAADPWMSRPMRDDFGLPLPEYALGLSAHDFVQCACAPRVVLTRAGRVEGAPSVPSRWLLRLETVLQAAGLSNRLDRFDEGLCDLAAMMDRPEKICPVARPEPRPPLATRPQKLSVTAIGRWMHDPYSIYAQYILKLKALDRVDEEAGAAERGNFIHKALEDFVRKYPDRLPENPLEELLACGRDAFAPHEGQAELWAFWWPRFERLAAQFIEHEKSWREEARPAGQESKGELVLDGFTLHGKADRIDRLADGALAIIDYKTGTVPNSSDIFTGFAPQLPLEAAMAAAGAFEDIGAAPVSYFAHWKVAGGRPPFSEEIIKKDRKALDAVGYRELAEAAEAGLRELVEAFANENTPYLPEPNADHKPAYNDYAHLERIQEWSVAEGDDS